MKFFGITLDSWFPWKIAGRIRMLTFVLDKIGKGDFSQMAPISQSDMIGKLGIKINEIADSLSKQINILKYERMQLETIINNMVEGVAVVDGSGVMVLANAAWYKIFGTSPKSLGHPILESVRVPQIYDSISASLGCPGASEVEFGVGDRFFVARSAPFETAEFKGCVTVVNDISKMRILENVRRDFSANVSHQMKTPLTSILGYSETLLQEAVSDPETSRRFVQTIHEQAINLKDLIEDVLGLARIESFSYRADRKEMDVQDAATAVAAKFKDNKKRVIVIVDVPKIAIISDRKAIEHALHNLIDNAVKYTPEGGRVKISGSEDGSNVLISVVDNGVGIPGSDISRIFERFYRVGGSDDLVREGTGLGLAIVKHLVEKLRGEIFVESSIGMGSTFTIKILKK